MTDTSATTNAENTTASAQGSGEFEPSPALLAMRKRLRSLVRSARTAAYFKPRLRRRVLVVALAARQRDKAEREQWERNA